MAHDGPEYLTALSNPGGKCDHVMRPLVELVVVSVTSASLGLLLLDYSVGDFECTCVNAVEVAGSKGPI